MHQHSKLEIGDTIVSVDNLDVRILLEEVLLHHAHNLHMHHFFKTMIYKLRRIQTYGQGRAKAGSVADTLANSLLGMHARVCVCVCVCLCMCKHLE
jgi:hypothetical protein